LDVNITEKWNYVLQSDLVSFDTGAGQNDEYGINQYLFYTVNDEIKLGSRVEWWSSDAGFNHGGQSPVAGGQHSYYEATFGVNYKPIANLIVRPEYRHDWFPHGQYEQDIFGIDAILTF
jgi:Putative beta-barrel porin-2, OmpL-like. bbp2